MKRLFFYFITIMLLSGCVGSAAPSSTHSVSPSLVSRSISVSSPPSLLIESGSDYNAASSSAPETIPATNGDAYPVTRIVDGDTFVIEMNGIEEKVRLLLVDTPESVHPDAERNVPYGKIASAFTKEQLEGESVRLEFDVQERDKYGRLLAYVYINDIMLNELLLSEGHATVSVYPPNVKYVDKFRSLESDAKAKKLGIWSEEFFHEPSTTTSMVSTSQPEKQDTAGSSMVWIPISGTKYHSVSGCSNMKNQNQITEDSAISMGYGRCKKCW